MKHLKYFGLGVLAKVLVFGVVAALNMLLAATEGSPIIGIGGSIIVLGMMVAETYFMGKGLSK